ncbi:MAG: allantoicase [Acidimicrobiia bacterium]|nr:allantoicase [Acidimicrobiia bacterium]MDH3462605.1 allantoicase [Acidimicrobiia bacterium]
MADMISSAVGGRVVECNDEFFAEAANLLNPGPPVWREDVYTDRGKWMDGWETRRRRDPGYDWCVLAMGTPGRIDTVTVDTAFFTGNYAEEFSLEACGVASDEDLPAAEWSELILRTGLQGDTALDFEVESPQRVTFLRLNIYPDGGVARLRVEGTPIPSQSDVCPAGASVDLVSHLVGGIALDASDAHYSPPSNMLRHTASQGMWDGWETKRRRGPGFDWATFELGIPGSVGRFVVDTRHFKGNAPGWVTIHLDNGAGWTEVVSHAAIAADTENQLDLDEPVPAARAKLEIHPDGGVARFRVFGTPEPAAAGRKRIEYLNALFDADALRFFHTACASGRWAETMTAARPYGSPELVLAEAEQVFDLLDEADWLEAFADHPRIGERGDEVANQEQAGAAEADRATKDELARVNLEYEERFGFTYIVYATGKTAEEMLALAESRVSNSRTEEMRAASEQQRLITATRLRRMLCQTGS